MNGLLTFLNPPAKNNWQRQVLFPLPLYSSICRKKCRQGRSTSYMLNALTCHFLLLYREKNGMSWPKGFSGTSPLWCHAWQGQMGRRGCLGGRRGKLLEVWRMPRKGKQRLRKRMNRSYNICSNCPTDAIGNMDIVWLQTFTDCLHISRCFRL